MAQIRSDERLLVRNRSFINEDRWGGVSSCDSEGAKVAVVGRVDANSLKNQPTM